MEENIVINIPVILNRIWRYKWLMAALIVLCGAGNCLLQEAIRQERFRSQSELYVPSVDQKGITTQKRLNSNTQMMNDLSEIGRSDMVLQEAAARMGINAEDLEDSLEIWRPLGTTTLQINGIAETPEEAREISGTVTEALVDYAEEELGFSGLKILEKAGKAVSDGEVSVFGSLLAGACAGLLAGLFWILFKITSKEKAAENRNMNENRKIGESER